MVPLLFGCTEGFEAQNAVVVDSSGVQIVTSSVSSGAGLQIDSIPDLELGGIDASGPEQFGNVSGIVVATDGSIWVSDRQTPTVQVFEADGTHRASVGGAGDGPGEFRTVELQGAARDSVAITDGRGGRLSWFSLDGTFLTSVSLDRAGGASPIVYGVSNDGTPVGVVQTVLGANELATGDTFGGDMEFVAWIETDDAPTVLAQASTTVRTLTERSSLPLPFMVNAMLSAGHQIAIHSGPDFEVRILSLDGGVRRIQRVERPRQPVNTSVRAEYAEFVEMAYPPGRQDQFLELVDHPEVPEYAPAYSRLLQTSEGVIWAQHWTPSPARQGDWDVFDSEGTLVATVPNPDRLWIHAVSDSAIYGVWNDELGVDHVRRHPLRPQ